MLNLGTVRDDQTIYIPIPTRAADGASSTGNTLADGDFSFHKDGSTTAATIDAAATTPSTDFATTTGRNQLAVDLSADSDFSNGSFWQVWLSKSIATETIEECVAVFRVESASEKAVRLLRDFLYPTNSEISTTTNNTTTSINCTDVVDAQTTELAGELLAVHDATNDAVWIVRVTAFTYPQATVEVLDGGVMPAAVASGDHVWRVGQHTATTGAVAEITNQTSLDSLGDTVNALDTNVDNLFGTLVQDSINDASATATGFTVTTSVGSDTRVGFLRLTSGTLEGESRLVSWQGTTVSVLSDSSMPTALKQFSAAPANSTTFDFRPL